MKLSKREKKYRMKTFQEYHLNKEMQKKVDCFILKRRRYNYEKLYLMFKTATNAINSITDAFQRLGKASVMAAQNMQEFATKMDENTSYNQKLNKYYSKN